MVQNFILQSVVKAKALKQEHEAGGHTVSTVRSRERLYSVLFSIQIKTLVHDVAHI